MSEKKYSVIEGEYHVIAENMPLDIALLLMQAYCEKYYMEHVTLTLREEDGDVCVNED